MNTQVPNESTWMHPWITWNKIITNSNKTSNSSSICGYFYYSITTKHCWCTSSRTEHSFAFDHLAALILCSGSYYKCPVSFLFSSLILSAGFWEVFNVHASTTNFPMGSYFVRHSWGMEFIIGRRMRCKERDSCCRISYIQTTEEECRQEPLPSWDIVNLVSRLVAPDIESNPPGKH